MLIFKFLCYASVLGLEFHFHVSENWENFWGNFRAIF